jgi:Helix-turn-helix domain
MAAKLPRSSAPMEVIKQILTSRDVADELDISQQSAQRLITQGYLPAIKLGYFWVVWRPDLDTFLEEYDMDEVAAS